jgi:hypothetical protein
MSIRNIKASVCGLLVAVVACAAALGYVLWQNHLWKESASGMAEFYGVALAKDDFRAGKLQLLVVVDERGVGSFRGSNDGPFRVSALSSAPYDYPSRYAAARVVESYNRKMRALHDHPERFIASTNAGERIESK